MRLHLISLLTGLLILVPITVYAADTTEQSGVNSTASVVLSEQAKQLSRVADQIQRLLPTAEEELEKREKEGATEAREKEDLKAQKDMAQWARFMFWATVASAVMAAIGTIVLVVTLRFTAEGLRTSAAALALSRNTAESQLRAYVGAEIRKIDESVLQPDIFHFAVSLKNHGATPARAALNRMIISLVPYGKDESLLTFTPEQVGGHYDLMPGGTNSANLLFTPPNPRETREGLQRMELNAYLDGDVVYKDVFGNEHCTAFRYCIGYRQGRFVTAKCSAGNTAT